MDQARAEGATVLFAIESGSRAWGFPSPDSDYDCRFVYVRRVVDHLVLQQPRDVMEFPVQGELDAGGWDLRKALLLVLSGNAVVVEWTKSTIVYEEVAGFQRELTELLDEIVDPVRVAHHYLGLARAHIAKIGSFDADVKLKKLFYLIRPLVALDWMQQRAFSKLPPMSLPECLATADVPRPVVDAINTMIEAKAKTREMGVGPIPPAIASYLEARYGHHEMNAPKSQRDAGDLDRRRSLAEAFYRRAVQNWT